MLGSASMNTWLSDDNIRLLIPIKPCILGAFPAVGSDYVLIPNEPQFSWKRTEILSPLGVVIWCFPSSKKIPSPSAQKNQTKGVTT